MSTTFFTATPEQIRRSRCRATWEAGDFGVVARYHEPAAAEFMDRLPLEPGVRVLDLACGTGNLAIQAARAGCRTCGLDLATNLIAQARTRAAAEGLSIEFTEGDAEALPYADASFDLVASMFGVMFAPHPERAVAELLRVCRSGAVIALANWTPQGLMGEKSRLVDQHVAPAPHGASPLLWGDEDTVRRRFGDEVSGLRLSRRLTRLHYPFTPARTVDFMRQFHGPTVRAFGSLDNAAQSRLHGDLADLFARNNRADDGTTALEAEYLEVIAQRR